MFPSFIFSLSFCQHMEERGGQMLAKKGKNFIKGGKLNNSFHQIQCTKKEVGISLGQLCAYLKTLIVYIYSNLE